MPPQEFCSCYSKIRKDIKDEENDVKEGSEGSSAQLKQWLPLEDFSRKSHSGQGHWAAE